MLVQNCAINSIAPFEPTPEKPWNNQRVAHLYRRLGFGANRAEIQAGLNLTPTQLVDQLIDSVLNMDAPSDPFWANFSMEDYANDPNEDLAYEHRQELIYRWVEEMTKEGIRSKIALFWHNHFVTEVNEYNCPRYMWAYYKLLHRFSLGNFKTFVEEIGKSGAMLVYLNGNANIADEPNENYARELLELFTMGENNGYTQNDIQAVARALTGWQANDYLCNIVSFDANLHDNNNKTIFGQTGNWDYNDVHNLIFTERKDEVAFYICSEIYKHFVYPEINETIVQELADTFKANDNWELAPVFRQLFKSEHFFDESLIGAQIKSPLECLLYPLKMADIQTPDDISVDVLNYIYFGSYELGQELFNPVNVAGWPGYRNWVNENTMANRWKFSGQIIHWYFDEFALFKLVQLADQLSNGSNNPTIISTLMARHFLARELDSKHLEIAVQYLKGDIPENYFQDGSWNLNWDSAPYQVRDLIVYLTRLPEYQMV